MPEQKNTNSQRPALNIRPKRRYESVKSVHNAEPDYIRPLWSFPKAAYQKILKRLEMLYGKSLAKAAMPELERVCQVYYAFKSTGMIEREQEIDLRDRFSEEDVILITYGDIMRGDDASPLTTLSKFCGIQLRQAINTIHILPFFPYSSDRGFSVVNFEAVDPTLGTWKDIEDLESRYQLMFDGVINHVSSQSRWFWEFLNGHPRYQNYFIAYDSPDALTEEQRKMIFRPRTSDILSEFIGLRGPRYVWTTFSRDQIDLNFQNPEVLIRVLEILLLYVRRGADLIRLDAITYLWSRPGTHCIHLDETHEIVKLFRDVLNEVAPGVALITETNVPHHENISYFGDGTDEARMVYNFALPPMLLHTFYSGTSTELTQWADSLKPPSELTHFFNFLDSHDGIGLMAVRDLLSREQIDAVVKKARSHGGLISTKTAREGGEVPYEINITWYSALNNESDESSFDLELQRFLCSRAIALALQGIPGIYLHSLLGTRNDIDTATETGSNRDINRSVVDYNSLLKELEHKEGLTSRLMNGVTDLIAIRTKQPAFHPNAHQKVLQFGPSVFALLRTRPQQQHILAIHNITDKAVSIRIDLEEDLGFNAEAWTDLISNTGFKAKQGVFMLIVPPYGFLWLSQPPVEGAD